MPTPRVPPTVLGLDIGGANLKAAHAHGTAILRPFELWKDPARLAPALRDLSSAFPAFDYLAITMTGELCDCFETKRQGVGVILQAVMDAAAGTSILVWQNDGRFVSPQEAMATPLKTAAANWLALATYAARFLPGDTGLVIDVGSTTTDLVPVVKGKPVPLGRTDPERLRSRELVYTGVRRTPLCALLGGEAAAELFATTLDMNLLLGYLPENAQDCATADGRPATRKLAFARLARMLCADDETCSPEEVEALARRACDRQRSLVREAIAAVIARLPAPAEGVVIAGSGEFLGRQACDFVSPIVSLAERMSEQASQAACAYAVARLAAERL